MNDIVVLEAAHDVSDGVALADVGQEFVAQTFAFAGTGDKSGNIDEFGDGVQDALRIDDCGELGQTIIGHRHDADVGFDGAKRIIFGGDFGARERIKQRRFADIGQTHDSTLKRH